jgi:multidrug efflux pump subunit AcrB
MREVSGALIAIILVLCSVFIPGRRSWAASRASSTRQFAVTVTVAVVISGFTALTLTPALCASCSRPSTTSRRSSIRSTWRSDRTTRFFLRGVDLALARRMASLIAFAIVLALVGVFFWRVPTSFVPSEDQGYLIGSIILPDAASLQRHAEDRRRALGRAVEERETWRTPSWCRAATSSAARTRPAPGTTFIC